MTTIPPSRDSVETKPGLTDFIPSGKPRLLMIIPWMTMGGADKFNLDLIEQLARNGWEVTIATTLPQPRISWQNEFSRFTPDIFVLPQLLRPADHPVFLRDLIRSRLPQIVLISNSELGYLVLPYLRSQCPEFTYVDYCHMEEEHWKNGGYPGFSLRYQEYLDLSIVTSRHLKDWMLKRGGRDEKIDVCYINVDSEYWKPDSSLKSKIRNEYQIEGNIPLILYAGRLCAQKQPQVFAEVMDNLSRSGLEFVSLAAGDGEDRDRLEKYIRKHSLSSRVKVLGPVSSARMHELMAAADIFFLPSGFEGIALTVYEAMSSGAVVVGADVGGQKELVDPESGVLLDTGNKDTEVMKYTEILTGLIKNPEARREMGEKARARIQDNFRLEQMGERMLNLFTKAQGLHATHPGITVNNEFDFLQNKELVDYMGRFIQPESGPVESAEEIPAEMKILLTRLYRKKWFRTALKIFFKLRLNKLVTGG